MYRNLECHRTPGLICFVMDCPGRSDGAACVEVSRVSSTPPTAASRVHDPRLAPALDPDVRDRVNDCPSRGPVLPLSQQDDCGCRGKELSECRAGRGEIPGRVTLRDCLACKAG